MNEKEFRVGETFTIDGKKYKCVKVQLWESCRTCAFCKSDVCPQLACNPNHRKDKSLVIFKLAEEGGDE